LTSVELLATVLVNQVTISTLHQPAVLVHSSSLLVHEETLLGLQ